MAMATAMEAPSAPATSPRIYHQRKRTATAPTGGGGGARRRIFAASAHGTSGASASTTNKPLGKPKEIYITTISDEKQVKPATNQGEPLRR